MSKLFFSFFILILVGCASALKRDPLKKPFVWKVAKDGRVSYLLGSIHAGVDIDEFPPSFWEVYRLSTGLGFESDYSKANIGKVGESMVERNRRQQGQQPLTELLSKEELLQAQRIFTKSGMNMDVDRLDRLSALGALNLFRTLYLVSEKRAEVEGFAESLKTLGTSSMDLSLQRKAIADAKVLTFLEAPDSVSVQNCMFGDEETALMNLREFLKKPSGEFTVTGDLMEIVKAYRHGDEAAILDLLKRHGKIQCLVLDRNRSWISKIERTHESLSPTIFVVGLAHILVGGQDSLVSLLRKSGYEVERASLAGPE